MKKLFVITFAVLLFSLSVFAQSNEQIEKELLDEIEKIDKFSTYGSDYDDEKLSAANKLFEEKLLKYTKIAATLAYEFDALDEHLYIAAADDGKFRVFSWDTQDGGTMHNYARIYQFQGADGKVYSKTDDLDEGDPGSFVYDVFTLDTIGGKIYMVCTTAILSTSDNYQAVTLHKIAGNSISDNVKIIKTKSGLTNSLSFGFNFFSVVDREERPVKLILYDKKAKTLKIPVVIEDEEYPNGRVTDKFIAYKFDGKYFVKTKS